jgi:WD40 repeat protein
MRERLACLLACVLASTVRAEPPRVDAAGDPLPPGEIMRLGTLQHLPTHCSAFWHHLDDGKTALVVRGRTLHWLDAATGKTTDTWRLPDGHDVVCFSDDGRLALIDHEYKPALWDVKTRKELRKLQTPGAKELGMLYAASITSDHLMFAHVSDILGGGTLHVWDSQTGRQLWHADEKGGLVQAGTLTDGTVVTYGLQTGQVSIRDRRSGKEKRSFAAKVDSSELRPVSKCGLSPDGKSLLVANGSKAIRRWDIESGKELSALDGHDGPALYFSFSPDGNTLVTGGLGGSALVRDWPSGQVGRKINLPPQFIAGIWISTDGRRLEVRPVSDVVVAYELETGKKVPAKFDGHAGGVRDLAFMADGKLVSDGADQTIRTWDVVSGRAFARLELADSNEPYRTALGVKADLVVTCSDAGKISVRERASGRVVRAFEHKLADAAIRLSLSHDARFLAVEGTSAVLSVFDVKTGMPLKFLDRFRARTAAFDPGARFVAVAHGTWNYDLEPQPDPHVKAHDLATGRVFRVLQQEKVGDIEFSPDGRALACIDPHGLTLWEFATGRERLRIPRAALAHIAFSPDGRRLAVAGGEEIIVRDLFNNAEATLAGHEGSIWALAFSPDGKLLASGSEDTTILLWDVAGVTARQTKRPVPDAKALAAAWTDLANLDAKKAYQAISVLVSASEPAARLLAEQLRPVTEPDRMKIQGPINQLGSTNFAERVKATRELEQLGELAESALRQFVAGNPPPEARRRAEELLNRLDGPVTDYERLRMLRAIEVLEQIPGEESTRLLRKLADGWPGSRLTQESARSLARRRAAAP